MSKLADLIYEVSQRMGAVTDYLLKEHGILESSRGSESFEVILNSVVEKTEAQEPKRDAEMVDAGSRSNVLGPAEMVS